MPLRSGLVFGGVVPQVGGCWSVRGCRNVTASNSTQPAFYPTWNGKWVPAFGL